MDALRRADVEKQGTGGPPPGPGSSGGGSGWRRLVLLAVLGIAVTLVARRFMGVDPQAPLEADSSPAAPAVTPGTKMARAEPGVVVDTTPPSGPAPGRRVPVPPPPAAAVGEPAAAPRVAAAPLTGEPTGTKAAPARVALPSGSRPAKDARAVPGAMFGAGDPAGIRSAALAAARQMQRGTFRDPTFAGAERERRSGETPEAHQARIAALRAERRAAVRALTPEQRAERMKALAQARQSHGAERLEAAASRAEQRVQARAESAGLAAVAPVPGLASAGPPGKTMPPRLPGVAQAPAPANVVAASRADGAAGSEAAEPVAVVPAPSAAAPPPLGQHQPAADRMAAVLRRPPAGAGDIKVLFMQWSLRPELRFAHVSLDGGRATQLHEGESLGDLKVVRIYDDIVEFSRGGNDFLLRVN